MKTSKKFVYIFSLTLVFFLMFSFFTYHKYVKYVNPTDYVIGDLVRMSYHKGLALPRYNEFNLSKRHIHYNDYKKQNVDMITIGDSFSNGGGGGLNRYYQDYIATYNELDVLNIPQLSGTNSYLETVVLLCNSGWLERKKIKYVLIGSVQRFVIDRFAKDINYDLNTDANIDQEIISSYDSYNPKDEDKQQITFINNLNLNALTYNLNFLVKGYGKNKKYYIEKLNNDFFTSEIKNELLFFYDDIRVLKDETLKNIKKVNDNFNNLAKLLSNKGIKLYFMPSVDKYNLYSRYITSNKYTQSVLFEELRKLPKEYILIDTKNILSKEIESGAKDIFYPDETHWSYKASKAIFKSVKIE
ncbi:hypothetical protein FJR48_02500 [Sulfurimonas lithotrophica]|uniref:AlgX/AlgJ SGNH hydrolase-like domain-containing protein n=1 Tax=Sulfurimonas lithotrophica TaxID=2590022 RepID=A0A5P8NYZ2_9BACT|nr:hypothetical protein [Sulfurimonas lithotrophica]QFR48652.1 hypothetical protein FJR48_02500 [Sulfurimonas lithotrophica]